MTKQTPSQSSIEKASKSRAKFSEHGGAGAKGVQADEDLRMDELIHLSDEGENLSVPPREGGFGTVTVGLAWDNVAVEQGNVFQRLFKKVKREGVDLDLGCLYELHDGRRGAIQAFGEMFGQFDAAPYMALSGDNKTGEGDGDDEVLRINGAHWSDIKRILIYTYIYDGAAQWSDVKPYIHVSIPGEKPMKVSLNAHRDDLNICAIAMMENKKDGLLLTNQAEFFQGHAEMDRAYGFGIRWGEGEKA